MIGTIILFAAVFLFCYLLAYQADKTSRKIEKIISLALIIIALSLLSGLRRYDVGIDTPNYVNYFLHGFKNYPGIESGYKILSNFLMSINESYTFGLTSIAFFTNILFVLRLWSLREISPFRYSFSVYYCMVYFLTFSGIRQWLAVAIVFYATKYIYDNRKLIIAIVLVIIAFLLHNSVVVSLLLIIPYVFEKSNSLRKKLLKLFLYVLAPIAGVATYSLLMNNYSYFLTDYARGYVSIGIMIPVRFTLLLMMLYFDFPRKQELKSDNLYEGKVVNNKIGVKKLLLYETIDLALNSIGFFASNTSRICWYYLAFTPVLYGRSLNKRYAGNTFYFFVKLLVLAIIISYYYSTVSSQTNNIVPYHFFWDSFI